MNIPFFIWKDRYSVNSVIIDNEHQNLFELINKLYRLFINKQHENEMSGILVDLVNYYTYHFAEEE